LPRKVDLRSSNYLHCRFGSLPLSPCSRKCLSYEYERVYEALVRSAGILKIRAVVRLHLRIPQPAPLGFGRPDEAVELLATKAGEHRISVMPLVRLVLGMLIAICAMYVAFRFTASAFGIGWAIPVAAVVFALTAKALWR
jgi:hypothetical protein